MGRQENLDTFLNIAAELQLKGLNGEHRGGEEGDDNPPEQSAKPTTLIDAQQTDRIMTTAQINSLDSESDLKSHISSNVAVALSKHEFSGNKQELNEQIKTMMGRGDSMVKRGNRMRNGEWKMGKSYTCQVCGKEGSMTTIRYHIEANHVEGNVIPCNLCEKTFRSRNALRQHNCIHHSNANK